MEALLNTREAARILGHAPGTLENWRTRGIGPKFIKHGSGGRVLYDPADLREWNDAHRISSTSEGV